MSADTAPRYHRYVALGDSSAEGLDDPDGRGSYRGWADRLADLLAREGDLLYANLAVRGRRARDVRVAQLPVALEMRPDLAAVFAGTNDAVSGRFDVEAVAADLEATQAALIASGARVVTFTMPDLDRVLPLARRLAPRMREFNQALRRVAAATGAVLVDFEEIPTTADPRLWSEDRFHANSLGHARIAAALAHALALPGSDDSWSDALPAPVPCRGAWADARWALRFLLPWVWRHARGHSSGDGRAPRRPELAPWPEAVPAGGSRGFL